MSKITWCVTSDGTAAIVVPPTHPGELRVGYICPSSGIVGVSSVGAAATMAISDGQRMGLLTNYNITLVTFIVIVV